jgi:hypothetical protein
MDDASNTSRCDIKHLSVVIRVHEGGGWLMCSITIDMDCYLTCQLSPTCMTEMSSDTRKCDQLRFLPDVSVIIHLHVGNE